MKTIDKRNIRTESQEALSGDPSLEPTDQGKANAVLDSLLILVESINAPEKAVQPSSCERDLACTSGNSPPVQVTFTTKKDPGFIVALNLMLTMFVTEDIANTDHKRGGS